MQGLAAAINGGESFVFVQKFRYIISALQIPIDVL